MTPHDKLCAAIAILQDHILAADTTCDPNKLLAHGRFDTASLELAAHLLGELQDLVWQAGKQGADCSP